MTQNPIIDPDTIAAYIPKPRFECTGKGVYYIAVRQDKDGNPVDADPLRLSDTLDVVGTGKDTGGHYYRIIRYRDKLTRQEHTFALSMAEIGSNAGWQKLQGLGVTVHSGRVRRERLADYLQTDGASTPYTVSDKAGWLKGSYILPNGDTITPAKHQPAVIYNGDRQTAYAVSGSLNEWQQQIARYAAGNSRLCLAIGTALAAPLLALLHEPNGGFHLYGDSSDGKTTAAKVALSVWGEAEALKMSWRGTDLGFSNAALARNDGLLVLDEIGEADPRTVSKTAYSVINGKTKLQGAKDGGNRQQNEWRVLLLSTGEYALKNYLERAGGHWEAGQSVRLPSIPAATRYGIYETLHGFPNGAALSDHLQDGITHQHGTAGRAWIALLQGCDPASIRAARDAFMHTLPDLDGQALRVAKRFALVSAALELAAPVTGLSAGVGMAGIRQCFDDWLALNGAGKYEDTAIIEQAEHFFQRYGDSPRFRNHNGDYHDRDHAGFYRELADQMREYWIIAPVFRAEIAGRYETAKVCKVLHQIGWLRRNDKDKKNQWRHRSRKAGWCYVFVGTMPPD